MKETSAKKIVLVGAGSAVFTRGLVADLILSGKEWELALVDVDPEALETAHRLANRMVASKDAPISLSAETDRTRALPDADYVVSTIGVGGRRAWEMDVRIPRRYGIYQPVGDTIMPGGLSRALRQIPASIAIAEDAARLSPRARRFNYANPMAAICQAVWRNSGLETVGLCHGVPDGARQLAALLDVEESRCEFTAVGINHLSFFVEMKVDGADAGPLLRQKLLDGSRPEGEHLRRQLFLDTGLYSVLHDRHLAEFFPQFYRRGHHPDGKLGVRLFSFEDTIRRGDDDYANMKAQARGDKPLDGSVFDHQVGEHEQLVDILLSLEREEPKKYSMILPNRGQVSNIGKDYALESPALVSSGGISALTLGDIPLFLKALMAKHLAVIDLAIQAAVHQDKTAFLEALIADGSADSMATAAYLAQDLWDANRRYMADA